MDDFIAKTKVVLKALPTHLAVVTATLTIVAAELIPLLPENIAIQAAGWIATALAAIAAVVRTISRVTPVLDSAERGLLPPGEN